jgi:hypothetical protein
MEVTIWIYGYYIVDILTVFKDGHTPCRRCQCSGLAFTESEWVLGSVTFELYFRTFVRTYLVTVSDSHPTRFRRGWTEF